MGAGSTPSDWSLAPERVAEAVYGQNPRPSGVSVRLTHACDLRVVVITSNGTRGEADAPVAGLGRALSPGTGAASGMGSTSTKICPVPPVSGRESSTSLFSCCAVSAGSASTDVLSSAALLHRNLQKACCTWMPSSLLTQVMAGVAPTYLSIATLPIGSTETAALNIGLSEQADRVKSSTAI